MLVHRAGGQDRERAPALLAEGFGPELPVPEPEGMEAGAVGHQHRGALRPGAHGGDRERGAHRRGRERGRGRLQRRREHRVRALAGGRAVAAGDHRRQQAHRRERRVAASQRGVVVDDLQSEALGKPAQGAVARLRDDGDACRLRHVQHEQGLDQGLGRGARLGDDQEAGLREIGRAEHALEAVAVGVVEEEHPLALGPDGGQRPAAQAGAAGAEDHETAIARTPVVGRFGKFASRSSPLSCEGFTKGVQFRLSRQRHSLSITRVCPWASSLSNAARSIPPAKQASTS